MECAALSAHSMTVYLEDAQTVSTTAMNAGMQPIAIDALQTTMVQRSVASAEHTTTINQNSASNVSAIATSVTA